MANAGGTAGIGIKLLSRKDTGAQQIIGLVPGGAAKLSGMLQENDTLLKVAAPCVRGSAVQAAHVRAWLTLARHVAGRWQGRHGGEARGGQQAAAGSPGQQGAPEAEPLGHAV